MKLIRKFCAFSAPLVLASCVTFPQTAEEFRANEAGVLDFSSGKSLQESYELVARNTIQCHQGNSSQMSMIGSSFILFPTAQTRVEGLIDSNAAKATITVRYFSPTASGLLQVVDFQAISDSDSRITVHQLNNTKKWQTATRAVQDWFSGGKECYEMW